MGKVKGAITHPGRKYVQWFRSSHRKNEQTIKLLPGGEGETQLYVVEGLTENQRFTGKFSEELV